MKHAAAVAVPLLLFLAGCLSAPIPQNLVEVGPPPAPDLLRTREIVRLSKAGISDEVVVDLIRSHGVADRPSVRQILRLGVSGQVELALLALPAEAPSRKPAPRIVYRELFVPLWPSYSRGRWHVGLKIGCYYRTADEEVQEILPEEPEPPAALPRFVDP